jgi:hypothetical protein
MTKLSTENKMGGVGDMGCTGDTVKRASSALKGCFAKQRLASDTSSPCPAGLRIMLVIFAISISLWKSGTVACSLLAFGLGLFVH